MRVWTMLGAGAMAALVLSGCDRREERIERAQNLFDAVREQLAEEFLGQTIERSPLERASVSERAFRGKIMAEAEVSPAVASQQSRFAVGSIIAKPTALEVIEAIEAEEPMDMVPLEDAPEAPSDAGIRSLPQIDVPSPVRREIGKEITRKPGASERIRKLELPDTVEIEPMEEMAPPPRAPGRGIAAVPAPSAPVEMKRASRRMAMSAPKIEAQDVAARKMYDAMSKYGLEGNVKPDASGQMVIEITAVDPTQFKPEALPKAPPRLPLPRMAVAQRDMGCPDTVSPASVQNDPILATECVIKTLKESGDFEYVEKDFILEHQFAPKPKKDQIKPSGSTPNDPLFGLQWHYRTNGDGEGQSPGGAGFAAFWEKEGTFGSEEVVVAVVDTGLQLEHPDIVGSRNVKPGFDFVSDVDMANDGDGRDADPNDPGDLCDLTDPDAEDSFHGTHVAGVIGAASSNNGVGISAAAWNVSIVPVRAMGRCGGKLSDINDAIRWSAGLIPAYDQNDEEIWNDNPADIINLSLGLFESCPASLQDAIDAVTERGVIVVAAAGNARISTQFYSPGGCRNVISVAAGDARGQIAPYSNYGAEVDILAPGGDLTRDDNGDGEPDGVLSTKTARNCTDPVTGSTQAECFYAYEQGTSMAAPHVSAALALIKAKYPDMTPEELVSTLLSAVDVREDRQCAGQCTNYPGATPIPGTSGLCARPCGGGLLNLAKLPERE